MTNDKQTYYYLHPEFVNSNNDVVEEATLCNFCCRNNN